MDAGQSLKTFAEALSARTPTPGGGSAGAVVGALAAALGAMAGRYTMGRKDAGGGPEDEALEAVIAELDRLRDRLLELAEADAAAYGAYARAARLPRTTEEERVARRAALREAARGALEVPLEAARLAARAAELGARLARECSRRLLSDAAACALLASCACSVVLLNVEENAPEALPDPGERRALDAQVKEIRRAAERSAAEALAWVARRSGGGSA